MAIYDLNELVGALLSAVGTASKQAQDQHVDLANRYFTRVEGKEEKYVPKTITLTMPSLTKPGEDDLIDVPLITLVPISTLMLSEVEFDFMAYISEISEVSETEAPRAGAPRTVAPSPEAPGTGGPEASGGFELPGGGLDKTRVKIGLGGGIRMGRNRMHVKVKIKAQDPPEGVMRVNDRILKLLP